MFVILMQNIVIRLLFYHSIRIGQKFKDGKWYFFQFHWQSSVTTWALKQPRRWVYMVKCSHFVDLPTASLWVNILPNVRDKSMNNWLLLYMLSQGSALLAQSCLRKYLMPSGIIFSFSSEAYHVFSFYVHYIASNFNFTKKHILKLCGD